MESPLGFGVSSGELLDNVDLSSGLVNGNEWRGAALCPDEQTEIENDAIVELFANTLKQKAASERSFQTTRNLTLGKSANVVSLYVPGLWTNSSKRKHSVEVLGV